MTAEDHHFRREDRAVRWQRIASHIAENPHDLAAVKLLVGRPKDISLLEHLRAARLLDSERVRTRLNFLDIPLEFIPRLHANFREVFGA